MFRAVAGPNDDAPLVGAKVQQIAIFDPAIADRHRKEHAAKAAPALGGLLRQNILTPSGAALQGQRLGWNIFPDVGRQHPRCQPFAARHPDVAVEPFAQPSGKADMVRVEMCADHAGDALALKVAVEQRLPGIATLCQ